MKLQKLFLGVIALGMTSIFTACKEEVVNNDNNILREIPETPEDRLKKVFKNRSSVDALVSINPAFNTLEAFTLISSPDKHSFIGDANKTFQLAGSPDGSGFIKDGEGYIYTVNCEDAYSVARIKLDKNLDIVGGDYLLNSGVTDLARQCSATMWEKEIHGGSQDLFLSASENYSFHVKGINPRISSPTPQANFGLPALGSLGYENIVPLPKDAYSGKTVAIGGVDWTNGMVTMYYSENGDADLQNGKLYVLRTKEIRNGQPGGKKAVDANTRYNETSFDLNVEYEVEFVEIENAKNLDVTQTGAKVVGVKGTQFFRVEDIDYQKGSDSNARNVYFNVTGKGDGNSNNEWGTVYKLTLDKDDPRKAKLKQIIIGHEKNGIASNLPELQSPDNMCVTENYIYIQEDPNDFTKNHNARIYQASLDGKNISKVLELVVNQKLEGGEGVTYKGEFGSLIDISDKIGIEGTFMLALQPHYWRSDSFKGFDGHDNSDDYELNEGGQILLLKGLPR